MRAPTDTPPGNSAPHAERTAERLKGFGFQAEQHAVPADEVKSHSLESFIKLIVRRHCGAGKAIALNAHGEVVNSKRYGRAAAVNKSDFATDNFAVRALEAPGVSLKSGIGLLFTYDEEFGGELVTA